MTDITKNHNGGPDVVELGDVVTIDYIGTFDDGVEFESTRDRGPKEFEVGIGRVFKGLENAVLGMKVGEIKSVHIPCAEAHGPVRQDRIQYFPRSECPDDIFVGQQLGIRGLFAVVRRIDENEVEVDVNHPLAGQDLWFHLELLELVKARTLQVGYTQGWIENPSHEEVGQGTTGHVEAVRVRFDPKAGGMVDLLDAWLSYVDLIHPLGRGRYVGSHYAVGVYFVRPEQGQMAEEALAMVQLQLTARPLVAPPDGHRYDRPRELTGAKVYARVAPAGPFYAADVRHQQLLEKLGQLALTGCLDQVLVDVSQTPDDPYIGPALFMDDDGL